MRLSNTLLVSLTFCILSSTAPVLAQNSTNIYEKDEETKALKTLTAKVRMASEDNGGWSVYFEGDKNSGVFFLSSKLSNFGSFTNLIEESRKPKGPHLKVTYDQDKISSRSSRPKVPPLIWTSMPLKNGILSLETSLET